MKQKLPTSNLTPQTDFAPFLLSPRDCQRSKWNKILFTGTLLQVILSSSSYISRDIKYCLSKGIRCRTVKRELYSHSLLWMTSKQAFILLSPKIKSWSFYSLGKLKNTERHIFDKRKILFSPGYMEAIFESTKKENGKKEVIWNLHFNSFSGILGFELSVLFKVLIQHLWFSKFIIKENFM